MLDVPAYVLFVILLIGFLRYAMRDLPTGELFGEAASRDETANKR
jgi:hypothetical protein